MSSSRELLSLKVVLGTPEIISYVSHTHNALSMISGFCFFEEEKLNSTWNLSADSSQIL